MTPEQLQPFIDAAGGNRPLAARMGITLRYVQMLRAGSRTVGGRLEELIGLKIAIPDGD